MTMRLLLLTVLAARPAAALVVVERLPALTVTASGASAAASVGARTVLPQAVSLTAPSAARTVQSFAPFPAPLTRSAVVAAPAVPTTLVRTPDLTAPMPVAQAAVEGAAAMPKMGAAIGPVRDDGEQAAQAAGRMFDAFGTPRSAADAAPVAADSVGGAMPAAVEDGWTRASFTSADGELSVTYKKRQGPKGTAPRVYAGGLALNESFDPLFARADKPARSEYFVWMRGHRPTGWTDTAKPIDADARDLARMIVLAARESGSEKVELALHSFGTLIFQRMIQLREEPEVAAALKALSGSRVVLLNATTHYEGSEKRAGREFEQMGAATKSFVGWLDSMDSVASSWEALAKMNPFGSIPIMAAFETWRAQRAQLIAMASRGAADMMRADLQAPWDPAIDGIRKAFLKALAVDSQNHGWQESLLRRSSDMFRLEFTKEDVKLLRRLKIRLDLIHSTGDQLLNWASAQTLFELLGIPAPAKAPAPGTVLSSPDGLFTASLVDADHYYPLKKRDDLARRLDP